VSASLGRLFAEVFDLCEQVAATITDAEVDARLEALLATGVLDEATETWTDLDEMLDAELPPCQIVYQDFGGPKPPPCGRPSAHIVTVRCAGCGPRQRACCDGHHRALIRRFARFEYLTCGLCGGKVTGLVAS
jgi:hypothetical protein